MRAIRPLVVLSAAAAITALGIGPAAANNESISFYGATASYLDATDQLCANAVNDYAGLEDYAIAYIENGAGTVVFMEVDEEGGGRSCTPNLSIPEDKLYYLRVSDCTRVPGTDCGQSSRKAFYS